MTCNVMAVVARSLKAHRANGRNWTVPTFKPSASVHVDARTFRPADEVLSLFTLDGRESISMRLGAFQRAYVTRGRVKEAELLQRRGRWYLHVVLDLPHSDRNAARNLAKIGASVVAPTGAVSRPTVAA